VPAWPKTNRLLVTSCHPAPARSLCRPSRVQSKTLRPLCSEGLIDRPKPGSGARPRTSAGSRRCPAAAGSRRPTAGGRSGDPVRMPGDGAHHNGQLIGTRCRRHVPAGVLVQGAGEADAAACVSQALVDSVADDRRDVLAGLAGQHRDLRRDADQGGQHRRPAEDANFGLADRRRQPGVRDETRLAVGFRRPSSAPILQPPCRDAGEAIPLGLDPLGGRPLGGLRLGPPGLRALGADGNDLKAPGGRASAPCRPAGAPQRSPSWDGC
jgi:hypothetical protein